ncbi:MAG: hypothetical protein H6737_06845 [Alphaproteobacteria bacterium]|nr:hypothetical protein [Alphaproteobacteria bacterium]
MALPWGLAVSLLPRGTVDLRLAVGAAVAARVVLLGTPPLLSDDLYRFLFEGVALNAGHNPFLEPPSSLATLDPWLAARVNHPDIPSIYPPVAQWWFRLLALGGARPFVAQLATAAVDVLGVALLHRLCVQRRVPTWPALVWALHPLPVLESANGAHLEPLALAACFGALLAFGAGRGSAAAGLAAVGAGIKLLPVLFAPAVVRALGPARAALAGLVGVLGLAVLAIPVLSAGPGLVHALQTYAEHWSFNGLVHPLLHPVLGDWTRRVLALVGLSVAAHAATHADPARTWRQVGAGFVLLSPTVHPWYVLWALGPSLVLGGRAWAVAASFLMGSYAVLLTVTPDRWTEPWWLGPATWGPALVALAAGLRSRPAS